MKQLEKELKETAEKEREVWYIVEIEEQTWGAKCIENTYKIAKNI